MIHGSASLRAELSFRGQQRAAAIAWPHELTLGTVPSVIFSRGERGGHGNFHPASFRNLCANPQWARRLTKAHTGYRRALPRADWRWRELDSSNSSDALLMNIFCYTRRLRNRTLCSLLGIDCGLAPEFGYRPRIPLRNGKTDRTEIDMRLGELLVEAKLTESGFQSAPPRLVERYRDFEQTFDRAELPKACAISEGEIEENGNDAQRSGQEAVQNYQLIRGILAAHASGGSFCLMCDARRPDLIEHWYATVRAVRDCSLRCRLQLITWQELTFALPNALQTFLQKKYGIEAA